MEKIATRNHLHPDEEEVIKGAAAVVFAGGADTVCALTTRLKASCS